MAIRNALIAVDFDGTVVTHAYPEIGDDAGAVPVLKELTDNGCRLILFTMRHGKLLDDAIRWFRERGIPLYAVNENPSQQRWTSSPKVHADLYIDDSSLGCPIRFVDGVKRPSGLDAHPGAVGEGRFSGLSRRAAGCVTKGGGGKGLTKG